MAFSSPSMAQKVKVIASFRTFPSIFPTFSFSSPLSLFPLSLSSSSSFFSPSPSSSFSRSLSSFSDDDILSSLRSLKEKESEKGINFNDKNNIFSSSSPSSPTISSGSPSDDALRRLHSSGRIKDAGEASDKFSRAMEYKEQRMKEKLEREKERERQKQNDDNENEKRGNK